MDSTLRELTRSRSGGYCEYCRVPEKYDGLPFQPDHIIAEKHEGPTLESNLAWSCYDCNIYKGPNIAGVDSTTSKVVPLFHPRQHQWEDHFTSEEGVIAGITPEGRATIATLRINLQRRVLFRQQLIAEGVYPLS